jgi:hypothetical protein
MTAPFIPMLFQGEEWGASTPTVACNLAAGMQRVLLRFGVAEVLLASDREVRLTDNGIDLPSESLAVLISTAGTAGQVKR